MSLIASKPSAATLRAIFLTLCLSAVVAAPAQQTGSVTYRYPERVLTPVSTGQKVSLSGEPVPTEDPVRLVRTPSSEPSVRVTPERRPVRERQPRPVRERPVRPVRERTVGPELDRFAVKTNLAYWATVTPNLSLEAALSPRLSLELGGGYHPWRQEAVAANPETGAEAKAAKRLEHLTVKPTLRYWLDRPFSKHFVGVSAIYGTYDVVGYDVPMLFEKEFSYKGDAIGGSVVYGYHWAFANRLRAEFSLGAGMLQMTYDRPKEVGNAELGRYKKTYFGPTEVGIKLVLMIR